MNNFVQKYKIYGPKKFLEFSLKEVYRKIFFELIKRSYSQKGEDLIIDNLLNKKRKGFYVDVGAYDPDRFSNTKRFYKKGWTGINIEPDFENYNKFLQKRSRDVNVNVGVGLKRATLPFYRFFPTTLSTFSKKEADRYKKLGYKFLGMRKVEVARLDDILKKNFKSDSIDFISIDTEGFEIEVLMSNDWKKFKPKIICIESSSHTLKKMSIKYDFEFLLSKYGYKKICDNNLNTIFLLKK